MIINEKENEIIKQTDSDLLKKYINDISNLKKLDNEMINKISNMSIEDIIKIIHVYNDITDLFNKFIQDTTI